MEKALPAQENWVPVLILSSLAVFFLGALFLMRIPVTPKKEPVRLSPTPIPVLTQSKTPRFLFLPASQTLKKGSVGTLQMGLDTGLTQVSQIQIKMEFDPKVFTIQKILLSSAFPQTLTQNINNVSGYALLFLSSKNPQQGKLIPGAILFKVSPQVLENQSSSFTFEVSAKTVSPDGQSYTFQATEKAIVNITP